MAEQRRKTLQELLANIAGGALAPATRAVGMSSPYIPSQTYPGAGGKPMMFPTYQDAMDYYNASPSPGIDRPNPANWATTADPTKPYGPQDQSSQIMDYVPRYSEVVDPVTMSRVSPGLNPYVFSQMTGKPSRTDFDDYIELLTARHPDFASEYRADPIAAINKYETSSGLSPTLTEAQQYHAGTLGNANALLTPQQMEQSYPMLANFPGMRPMTFSIPDVSPTAGPMLPTGGLLANDPLADPLGLGPLETNNSGGLLGTV